MNVQEILNGNPLFHVDEHGNPISWGIGTDVLSYLDEAVNEGDQTLETGSGLSTVVFAIKSANHRCITPSESEVARIKHFCDSKSIPITNVSFRIGFSEDILPRLDGPELDLILIDGRHGFPAPFIDWYYTARRLKIGGQLLVDDTQLWPCAILRDFLMEEPEWRLTRTLQKTAVFVKLQHGSESKEWNQQPFIVRHTG